jgi:hypothetical protein
MYAAVKSVESLKVALFMCGSLNNFTGLELMVHM